MTNAVELSVAKDFSEFPAGRYDDDGPFPGEGFRRLLVDRLGRDGTVTVSLDGTMGYGSSFLEEAFGGLVRIEGFTLAQLSKRLTIVASDETLVAEVWSYIKSAKPERGAAG
jgi:hypothetical protein